MNTIPSELFQTTFPSISGLIPRKTFRNQKLPKFTDHKCQQYVCLLITCLTAIALKTFIPQKAPYMTISILFFQIYSLSRNFSSKTRILREIYKLAHKSVRTGSEIDLQNK